MPLWKPLLAPPLCLLASLALVCGSAARAHGQPTAAMAAPQPRDGAAPPPQMPAPASSPARRWYGHQIMLGDVASWAVLLIGEQAQPPLGLPGAVGLFAIPSAIHRAHDNSRMAVASPLLRLGLMFGGAVFGAAVEHCSNDEMFCGVRGMAVGASAGMLTAMIVDYCLAFEKVDAFPALPARATSRPNLSSVGMAPTAGGAALLVGGRF